MRKITQGKCHGQLSQWPEFDANRHLTRPIHRPRVVTDYASKCGRHIALQITHTQEFAIQGVGPIPAAAVICTCRTKTEIRRDKYEPARCARHMIFGRQAYSLRGICIFSSPRGNCARLKSRNDAYPTPYLEANFLTF